jgi:hypothetical protein
MEPLRKYFSRVNEKKMMKTKITILLALFLNFYSFAQVGTIFTSGVINYKITTATTVEVSTNIGITGAVSLPSNLSYNTVDYVVTGVVKRHLMVVPV